MLSSFLVGIAAIFACILILQFSRTSFGLPAAYLFILSTIHLPGAFVHILHPDELPGANETTTGLELTSSCMIFFVIGVCLSQLFINSQQAWLLRQRLPLRHDPQFWRFCTQTGLILLLIFAPLQFIPSLGALYHNSVIIWVPGVILALRYAVAKSNYKALIAWTITSLVYPFVALAGQGFLGYGISSFIQVYSFLIVRPKRFLSTIIFVVIVSYLGLGVAVSYLDGRDGIRDSVWGNESLEERLTSINDVLFNVSLFDPEDREQALLIDSRLNQNFLIGAAEQNFSNNSRDFLDGLTYQWALLALIPRAIWPDKPVIAGSGGIVSYATGIYFAGGTSVGVGNVMEAFINFGRIGAYIFFIILGFVIRWLDFRAFRAESLGNYQVFLGSFLPCLSLMQPGGVLMEITSSALASCLAAWLWSSLWQYRQKRIALRSKSL
jgi:hypothetical protein